MVNDDDGGSGGGGGGGGGDAAICPRDHSIYVSAQSNIPIGTPRNRRYATTYARYTKANMNKSGNEIRIDQRTRRSDKSTRVVSEVTHIDLREEVFDARAFTE